MNVQQKIEANGEEITDKSLFSTVWRIENGVSQAKIAAADKHAQNFVDNLDPFDVLKVSYKYGYETSFTQVFEGYIREPEPQLSQTGKTTAAHAWGYGRALIETHCGVNYGVESENSAFDTPSEIIDDLKTNRINKNFDAGNTGHGILGGKILAMSSPSIQFIKGGYRQNVDILTEVMLAYQAWRAGSAGLHWFVGPSKYLYIDQIGNHTVAGWDTWWRTNQADSTLTEGVHFTDYKFSKKSKGYANKVLLFTNLRKPGYDYWTEDSGGASLWESTWDSLTDDNTAGYFVVGSHSLKMHSNAGGGGHIILGASYMTADANAAQKNVTVSDGSIFSEDQSVIIYDSTPQSESNTIDSIAGNVLTMENNLTNNYTTANGGLVLINQGWNFSKIGSEENSPKLNFYSRYGANIATATTYVYLHTNWYSDYFYMAYLVGDTQYAWHHKSLPIGKYWKNQEASGPTWLSTGTPDWEDIKHISFLSTNAAPGGASNLWLDDLHFSGKIIREAYDSTDIAAKGIEIQKIIRMDTAVDDSMVASDDTGTAARLAYAELLRAETIPTVGTVTLRVGAHDILPGQKVYVNAHKKSDGTYAIAEAFRATQIIHNFTPQGYTTKLDLSNDLVNSFGSGPSEQLSAVAKLFFVDPEAKSLKFSGIDEFVDRLSVDYP